ncbi:MAG: tetratricopeptide repeat protein [Candidatus Gastranaerophilales bacterium]|nr:tetratricopeptide repeat protein [Candidatus Gastranaerophilales bacterium]
MKTHILQKKILKYILSAFIFIACANSALAIKSNHGMDGYVQHEINAVNNARLHSNMGNIFFDEKKYISALKEYEIAYNLAPNHQASGVYLHNIAKCYVVIGDFVSAKNAIEGAIKKDCINMTYYEMLVDLLIKLKIEEQEIDKYIKDNKNPYNRIIIGLIYLKTDRIMQAKITFDDFVEEYPDMIITQDVKTLLRKIKKNSIKKTANL